jgi:cysteine synthase
MIDAIHNAVARVANSHPHQSVLYLPEFSRRVGNTVHGLLGSALPSGSLKYLSVVGLLMHLLRTTSGRSIQNVVASTSGNTGKAAAEIFRDTRIKFHAVLDVRTPPGKKADLVLLGAEIEEVSEPDPTWIEARLRRTSELVKALPGAVDLDQYQNPGALEAHFRFTGPLIWQARRGQIDIFVAPIGTGGISGGTSHFLRRMNPRIATVPVDCTGSIVLGKTPGPHLLTGLGAHVRCANVQRAYAAMAGMEPRIISDAAAFREAHWLREHDGVWVGGSSGAALAAIAEISREVQGKRVFVPLVDGGEAYAETIFNPLWLASHGVAI